MTDLHHTDKLRHTTKSRVIYVEASILKFRVNDTY